MGDKGELRVKGQCQEMCQLREISPPERESSGEMRMNEWKPLMDMFQGNSKASSLV